MTKNGSPSISGFALIKEKTTSIDIIKRYAEIESPCLVPLSNLEYGVVLSPLITHDSRLYIKICILFRNSLPNPSLFQIQIQIQIQS